MVKLLVPNASEPHLRLLGHPYALVDVDEEANTVDYVCVSYAWGPSRVPSPLDTGALVSDRTLPVLEAALGGGPLVALWIDGLCVPSDEPAKSACLLGMGAIYGGAARVVVVLSPHCAALLEQANRDRRVDEAALLTFEQDEWVTRAWTYQEVVNSRTLYFVAEGSPHIAPVEGENLLNFVGHAISDYKKAHAMGSFAFRQLHPRLDGLEDLIADWSTAAFLERSAYQIMATMHPRLAERPGDRLYAMTGAVSVATTEEQRAAPVDASEWFMQLNERKGDFSFVYASGPRSREPGKYWRPAPGELRAVLPWHTHGEQPGSLHPTHVRLDQMHCLTTGPLDSSARKFIQEWLISDGHAPDDLDIATAVYTRLKQAGFEGPGQPIEVISGLFFPASHSSPTPCTFAVATQLRWPHGTPGLVLRQGENNAYQYVDTGVFVGEAPKQGAPLDVC